MRVAYENGGRHTQALTHSRSVLVTLPTLCRLRESKNKMAGQMVLRWSGVLEAAALLFLARRKAASACGVRAFGSACCTQVPHTKNMRKASDAQGGSTVTADVRCGATAETEASV